MPGTIQGSRSSSKKTNFAREVKRALGIGNSLCLGDSQKETEPVKKQQSPAVLRREWEGAGLGQGSVRFQREATAPLEGQGLI